MTTRFHLTFLGGFILSITGAMAQAIAVNSDAVWYEEFWLYDGLNAHHSSFTLAADGDTLIEELAYTKIHQLGVDSISVLGSSDPAVALPLDRYLGAIRADEIANKWYVYFDGYPNELLLYDFNLTIGSNTLGIWGDCGIGLGVTDIDTVMLDSEPRQRYHLGLPGRFIIEGIGSSTGLFGQLCQFFEEFSCLNEYEQPDALLLVNGCGSLSTSIQLTDANTQQPLAYPNPTTGIVHLGGALAFGTMEVRDGLGRTVLQAKRPQPGTAIDLGPLAPGHYTLHVGAWIGRVVKE